MWSDVRIGLGNPAHSLLLDHRPADPVFRLVAGALDEAVIATDLAGSVAFMNGAAERLTGSAAAASNGRPFHEIVRSADSATETPLDLVLRRRERVESFETRITNRDRSTRIVRGFAGPILCEGTMQGAVEVMCDVTDRKLFEARLDAAERLASAGMLVCSVAHEINNPLSVIVGQVDSVSETMLRVRRALARTEDARELLGALDEALQTQSDIRGAADRIARIVSRLRDTALPRGPEPSGDVVRACEWAVRATAPERRMRARLQAELAPVPAVRMDEGKLTQVVINLLTNAAQAIPPGNAECNRVTIACRTKPPGDIEIRVGDTGCGIPPDQLDRIFDPFFTTKAAQRGTGLGLAVSAALVQAASGRIEVESRVGEGTTFTVTLPAATLPAGA